MKKLLPACFRGLICSVALLFMHFSTFASHIVGGDLNYTWISGNTYRITVILYGDCGPSSTGAFQTLQISSPQVCVYNGNTFVKTLYLPIQAPSCGVEITPVCPADSLNTQCHISSSPNPGIKKFVYSEEYTLPTTSRYWRFIYTSRNDSGATGTLSCGFSGAATPSGAGRAAAITNISPFSLIQLEDTLNNSGSGIYTHNTSPLLTVVPTPYFCINSTDCYNPGAVDPDGDSLIFALTPAGNGTSACGTVGGSVSYVGTAWPGQPVTAATPLSCTAGSFAFDPTTGQICFYPNVLQRSVVVYNIEEFRNDTFMGTSQREMTFLVLTCVNTGPIATYAGLSGLDSDNTTHFHICGNSGAWCVTYDASEPDTSNLITLTVTGLSSGMTYSVTANGTNHPVVTVCGNTSTMPPGLYTFFLHMQDNNCPLTGVSTQAISINIYPVPTIHDSIAFAATCFNKAVVYITPGGTGKPWTIDVSGGGLDTFQTFVDSVMFVDSLAPGTDTMSIFTDVSHQCNAWLVVTIDPPPPIVPIAAFTNPTYCGATDGTITLSNLAPGVVDTVRYNYNGVPAALFYGSVSAGGTLAFPDPPISLPAGTYDNIVVTYGFCHSDPIGPLVLVNPPFPIRTLSSINPNRCGYCNGAITIYGLNPNQLDTIYYTHNGTATSVSYYVGPDSLVLFTGLCDGDTYTSFFARTDSLCLTNTLVGVTLKGPTLQDSFKIDIDYGCHGDTVIFTNTNYSDSDHLLTYHWYFGDGYTDTAQNPNHIYFNGQTDTAFSVKLYATNGECVDSVFRNLKLLNYIHASYTFTPAPYVCQLTPVDFTNTSVNLSPPDSAATIYAWNFGNGNTSIGPAPVNTYNTTGIYTVTLIETNFVPCSDTFTQTVVVDTISNINMLATDTTVCRGKDITFTALYAGEGSTGNVWSISDGFSMVNVNPILHGFDQAGQFIVTVTAQYRACPETTATKIINVFSYPDVYLGADTTICPGSNSIILADNQNDAVSGASWLWNTGETTSSIVVVKPGYYYTVVTMNGCSSSDTVWVQKDCYMDIPNVFTPNGDGVNDYFYPRQFLTRGLTSFNMNIYNRWGQLVYTTTSLDGRGWDGTFNGQPQPEAAYVYIIDATFKDGQNEHHQGNVTLLR